MYPLQISSGYQVYFKVLALSSEVIKFGQQIEREKYQNIQWKTVAQSVANKWEQKFDFDINNNGFIDGGTSYR